MHRKHLVCNRSWSKIIVFKLNSNWQNKILLSNQHHLFILNNINSCYQHIYCMIVCYICVFLIGIAVSVHRNLVLKLMLSKSTDHKCLQSPIDWGSGIYHTLEVWLARIELLASIELDSLYEVVTLTRLYLF